MPCRLLTDRGGHKHLVHCAACIGVLRALLALGFILFHIQHLRRLSCIWLVGLPNSSLCCRYIGSGAIRSGTWWCCVRKSLKVTGSAIIACVLDWLVYQILLAGLHRPFGRALWCLFLFALQVIRPEPLPGHFGLL